MSRQAFSNTEIGVVVIMAIAILMIAAKMNANIRSEEIKSAQSAQVQFKR